MDNTQLLDEVVAIARGAGDHLQPGAGHGLTGAGVNLLALAMRTHTASQCG